MKFNTKPKPNIKLSRYKYNYFQDFKENETKRYKGKL